MPPPDVSLQLPYTEDWESGMINPNAWLPSDKTLLSLFSIVDDEDGKALQFSTPDNEVQLVGGDVGWTDIKLEVKMKIVSGDPTAAVGVRFNALKTFYYIEIGNEHFKIRDRNNGASDVQPTGDEPPLVAGQWYTVGFIIQGQTVTGQLDGVDIATGPLEGGTPVANGGIALGCKSGFEGVLLFDDVTVSAP
jgi:hypothetical protein